MRVRCPRCQAEITPPPTGLEQLLQECPQCGEPLPAASLPTQRVITGGIRCVHCGAVNAVGAPRCRQCGQPPTTDAPGPVQLTRCTACGAPNSATAEVCRACGRPIAVAAPPPERAVEPPAVMPGLGTGDVGPTGFGNCLDRAFAIFRANLRPMFIAASLVTVPMALSGVLAAAAGYLISPESAAMSVGNIGFWRRSWEALSSGSPDAIVGLFGGSVENRLDVGAYALLLGGAFLQIVVMMFSYPAFWGLVCVLTAQTHLGRGGDAQEAWRLAKRAYWPLVGVGITVGLSAVVAATVGVCCLMVPYVLLMTLLVFYAPVIVFEDRGIIDGLNRTVRLVSKDYVRVLWWNVVAVVILWAVTTGLATGANLLAQATLVQVLGERSPVPVVVGTAMQPVAQTFYMPIIVVFRTLMYFDARARQEALDLRLQLAPVAEAGA